MQFHSLQMISDLPSLLTEAQMCGLHLWSWLLLWRPGSPEAFRGQPDLGGLGNSLVNSRFLVQIHMEAILLNPWAKYWSCAFPVKAISQIKAKISRHFCWTYCLRKGKKINNKNKSLFPSVMPDRAHRLGCRGWRGVCFPEAAVWSEGTCTLIRAAQLHWAFPYQCFVEFRPPCLF